MHPDWHFELDRPVNLVLSPHYYWSKKSDTAFGKISAAKRVAASLFDLDEGFAYDVYENENKEFIFVAYNPQQILNRLKEQGINPRMVRNVYLAQAYFMELGQPLKVDEETTLMRIESIVVIVPSRYARAEDDIQNFLKESSAKLPRLPIAGIGSFELGTLRIPLIAAALMVSAIILLEIINLYRQKSELILKQEQIKQEYKLPPTTFQLKSMLARLKKIDTRQSFIRKNLYRLSKERREIAGRLESVHCSSDLFEADFKKSDSALEGVLKKAYPKALQSRSESGLHIEVKR